MTLHVSSSGDGAPLVLLHGWGMHGGIWGSAAEQLAQRFRVHCVDLPGHGRSVFPPHSGIKGEGAHVESGSRAAARPLTPTLSRRERGRERLDAIVSTLATHFVEPVNVCGWSLGGQVALRWALRHPQQVKKLILAASTPCFVQRPDWRCAIAGEVLQEFADALEQNYLLTLKRFVALQVRGSENERALLQEMRERLTGSGEPDKAALREGLEILRDTDLRGDLARIMQPALVIAGERDTLTPPAASAYLAQTLPNARMMEIGGAAHALFLSHPERFVKHVTDFIGQ